MRYLLTDFHRCLLRAILGLRSERQCCTRQVTSKPSRGYHDIKLEREHVNKERETKVGSQGERERKKKKKKITPDYINREKNKKSGEIKE